jgi:hypothetical protein
MLLVVTLLVEKMIEVLDLDLVRGDGRARARSRLWRRR